MMLAMKMTASRLDAKRVFLTAAWVLAPMKNPHLKKAFETFTFLYDAPLSISQVSFAKKTQVEDHVIMAGDAAGMITPLCGNGMSMAMNASKILADLAPEFLNNAMSRSAL